MGHERNQHSRGAILKKNTNDSSVRTSSDFEKNGDNSVRDIVLLYKISLQTTLQSVLILIFVCTLLGLRHVCTIAHVFDVFETSGPGAHTLIPREAEPQDFSGVLSKLKFRNTDSVYIYRKSF